MNLHSCPESIKSQATSVCGTPILKNTATTLRESNEAPPDFEKKTVMEGTRHCHQPAKQFELPSIKTETQNLVTYKIVYKIVNSKIAVDIQDYISRPTRISRSYHGRRFNNISSNSNTYNYNFYALPSTQVAGYSAVKPNLLWSLLNLL